MTTPTGLELVWANAGGFDNPGNAKYQLGWIAEIPSFQNFNYVLQALDRAKLSYAEKDIHTWNDKIAYVAGARVERGDKTFYCKTPHNQDPFGAPDPQDPLTDTTNSYWVYAPAFSSAADAFTNLDAKQGLLLHEVHPSSSSVSWNGNALTASHFTSLMALNTREASKDNLLFGNVGGKMVVVNVGNTTIPDGRLLSVGDGNTNEVYHEGHRPTQSEVDGTIPESPIDGKLYARQSGNWVEVTSTTVSMTPPAAAVGAGRGWYNLNDGQFYIDIFDGDTSQWVPANPPVVPDLAPIKQRVADLSNALVGMESYFPPLAGDGVHPAWIEKAGGEFSRLAHPSLYAWAVAHNLVVTEANWQAIKAASPNGSVSVFSFGDGTNTFRVPDVGEQGGFARAIKGATGGTVPVGDLDSGFGSISAAISGSNETSPRGTYQRVYIYTGNIVEDLPTPAPNWLSQQDVNTNTIADLLARIVALEAKHP